MQAIDQVIPEITNQILNPASEQVVRHVLKRLNVYDLFNDNLFILSPGESSSSFSNDNHKRKVHENRCTVEINPSSNPMDTMIGSFVKKDSEVFMVSNRHTYKEYPVFGDSKDKISLYEMGVPCVITMEFSMKLKSLELVDSISTALFADSMTGGGIYNYHTFQYNYSIPDHILIALYKMFQLKDFGSSTVTFPDYLKYGSNGSIGKITNRDTADKSIDEQTALSVVSISRSVTNVLGKLSYGGNKPSEDKINKVVDRYEILFEYTFQMFKPCMLKLLYPVMINNTLLPEAMVKSLVPEDHREEKNLRTRSFNEYYDKLTNGASLKTYTTIRYPNSDNWRWGAMYMGFDNDYIRRVIALLQVDTVGTVNSITLDIRNDIYPMLDIDTIAAIDDVFEVSTVDEIIGRQSIFGIMMFSDDSIVDPSKFTFDISTLILTVDDVDPSKRYRFVLTQNANIKLLPYKFIYYMLDNYEYYKDYLTVHLQYLENTGYLDELIDPLTGKKTLIIPKKYHPPKPYSDMFNGRAIDLGNYVILPNFRRRT